MNEFGFYQRHQLLISSNYSDECQLIEWSLDSLQQLESVQHVELAGEDLSITNDGTSIYLYSSNTSH